MIIAIDIGSINLIVASLDKNGQIMSYVSLATPTNPKDATDVIIATIASQFINEEITKIVIGVPGPVKNNCIAWCSNLGEDWTNYDLAATIEPIFKAPVLLENDANLAGLGEVSKLAFTPKNVLFLTIGAGIGSSILINGKLVNGLLDSEAGMTCLEYDGVIREWEKFASGKAIYQAYGDLAENIKSKSIWEAITDRIARGILVLIPIMQPDLIIIGGSIGKSFRKFSKQLNSLIDEKLPQQLARPKIIAAHDPEFAVIHGAYHYAKHKIR